MKEIQNLFDDYAENLSSQPQLSAKARQQMTSARPKTAFKFWKPLVAVCCVLVFVVVLGNISQILNSPNAEAPANFAYYNMQNVKGQAVDSDVALQMLPLGKFEDTLYSIVSQKYCAYYFVDSNQFAYIKGVLGVSTYYGIVELTVIAENEEYLRSDLAESYQNFVNSGETVWMLDCEGEGAAEWVTWALFSSHNMHFYVYAQSNYSNKEDAKNIVRLFV